MTDTPTAVTGPTSIGPAGAIAADSAFGVALVTLWHRVSLAGGAVGFVPTSTRPEVAAAAADTVDQLRRGRADGFVLNAGRTLIGFVKLTPGTGLVAHSGVITALMVDPDHQGAGWGRALLRAAEVKARERGLERLSLSARGGTGLDGFYQREGYQVWGIDPGRVRVAPGDDRDEIHLVKQLT